MGFETYFSILDELEIFNVVKTDNDLRAVTGKGTYSVLGFSRCNNYIGEKRLPTKQIQENSVSAKRSLYNSNINTLDKIRSDFHIFLSKVDLENDLDEFCMIDYQLYWIMIILLNIYKMQSTIIWWS